MPAPFRLYNTLSRTVEPFEPLEPGKVSLYVCGMTVYDHAHVGHARAMVVFDTLVRYLRHRDWDVTFVRNFTDVDDKIIRKANATGVAPMEIAETFIASFHEDADGLELLRPDEEPRVSTSMDEIIAMVVALVEKGHAYEQDGSVWFDVASYPEYGGLSGQKVDELRSTDVDSGKRSGADFAVWKAAKAGEPSWESPWGPGRPGWHIECSAMNRKCFGHTIDIHGGGLDLVFPHHENEIAQSVCANGSAYVRYWMHNGLLTMTKKADDGSTAQAAKMGKSEGNAFNIHDALARFPAEALRLYYLQSHYRSPLPWSAEALPDALAMLARLYEAREAAEGMSGSEDAQQVADSLGPDAQEVLRLGQSFDERFHAGLDDDLNTAMVLGHAFELARAINRLANHKKAKKRGGPVVAPALKALTLLASIGLLKHSSEAFQEEVKDKRLSTMGVSRDQVEALIVARAEARTSKDWARADALRDELDALGIVVMDSNDGVVWRVRLSAA